MRTDALIVWRAAFLLSTALLLAACASPPILQVTPGQENGPVRFAVVGDYGGGGPVEREVADLVRSFEPDFVNGLGGHPERYEFGDPRPGSAVRYRDDRGAMRVTATPGELVFEFVRRGGRVVDRYALARPATGVGGPPPERGADAQGEWR
jgi:hypothetical protein